MQFEKSSELAKDLNPFAWNHAEIVGWHLRRTAPSGPRFWTLRL